MAVRWIPYRWIVSLLAVVIAFGVLPMRAAAADLRSGENVTIPATERITEDLYVAGSNVTIDAPVDGDLWVGGRSIVINGDVTGNIFAAGETVTINGAAGRGVKAAGRAVVIQGSVGTDLFAIGENVTVGQSVRVGTDSFISATRILMAGQVDRRLFAYAGSVEIAGTVNGDVQVQADNLSFGPMSRVAGAISYVSNQEASIQPGAQLAQPPQRTVPEAPPEPAPGDTLRAAIGGAIAHFLVLFGIGALVLWLVRRTLLGAEGTLRQHVAGSLLLGVLVVFVPPIVIVLLAILLGIILSLLFGAGAWLAVLVPAVIGLGIWWLLLYLSPIVVGAWLGRWLLQLAGQRSGVSPYLALAIGLAILVIIGLIPIIGGLVSWLLVPLFGAGALVYFILRRRQEAPPAPPESMAAPA